MKKVYCLYCKNMTLENPIGMYPVVGCLLCPHKKLFIWESFWEYNGRLWYGSAKKKNRHNDCPDFSPAYTQDFIDKQTNNGE